MGCIGVRGMEPCCAGTQCAIRLYFDGAHREFGVSGIDQRASRKPFIQCAFIRGVHHRVEAHGQIPTARHGPLCCEVDLRCPCIVRSGDALAKKVLLRQLDKLFRCLSIISL